jgi:formylglycine-generating enzyme required for sulfatase activity
MKPALACGLALLAAATGCAQKATPTGGLLVKMTTTGTFPAPLTRLHVAVGPVGDGAPFDEEDYPIASEATFFPASLGVRSNGDPASSVTIDVSVWSGDTPVDVRRYEVFGVPTTAVQEVDIVFSPRCTPYVVVRGTTADSLCGPTGTCDPGSGACASDVYGRGDDGGMHPGADKEAGVLDGGLETGAGDAAAEPGDAGGADASAPCDPDGGPQCKGNTPQQCLAGQWVDQLPCASGMGCTQGICRPVPPSCAGQPTWPCTSLQVPGGSFDRSYDGVTFTDASSPATVHGFLLDELEVTSGRFLAFRTALDQGSPLPAAGAGKHAHLNGGRGLLVGFGDAGPVYESGWDPSWAAGIATTADGWNNSLTCIPTEFNTYGDPNMDYPVNCVTWFEAYAFCIWDGGFLPTEAEWNFAASGGDEQRVFPWGSQDPGIANGYAIYGCHYAGSGVCLDTDHDIAPVGSVYGGVGRWGQWDLAGNMAEWTLDAYLDYATPCVDCAAQAGSQRVFRGGSYDRDGTYLYSSSRVGGDPATRDVNIGFRCARSP